MRVRVLVIGHTHEPYVKEGIARYTKRLPHYCTFEYVEMKDISAKGLSPELQKSKEGELILKQLKLEDQLCLLDEKGKMIAYFPSNVTPDSQEILSRLK